MNLSEPNITLKNISEVKDGGLKISLLKLLNEAFNKDKSDVRLKRTSNKINSNYSKLLSVIICTLNIGTSFLKAAESVLNQEFPADKYEIIVVNNSDTPIDTEKLPHKIKVVNEPSKGLSKARNTGAARAAGEYLLYIDDDAVANENLLFNMFNAFEGHKNYAIIGGQIFLRLPEPAPTVFLKGKEALWSGYTVPYKKLKSVNNTNFRTEPASAYATLFLTALAAFPMITADAAETMPEARKQPFALWLKTAA